MKGWRSKTVSAIREEFDEINDSMKSLSSRMKTKVSKKGGGVIKMKQENMYIYQCLHVSCTGSLIDFISNAYVL